MNQNLKKVMWLTLAAKAVVIILVFLGSTYFSFHEENYRANFTDPPNEPITNWTFFKTWDAQHYLHLAEKGYTPDSLSNAFYPLFPFLIRILSFLFLGNSLITGLFLSHLFTFLAIVCLFRLVRKLHDEKTAWLTCLMLLSFPMAFYLGFVYTESLFLLLSSAYFYYHFEKKIIPAALCAFLLPLTRSVGVLTMLPILLFLMRDWKSKGWRFALRHQGLPAIALAAGLGAYWLIMKVSVGDFFAGYKAADFYIGKFSALNILHPFDWLARVFFNTDFSLELGERSLLTRLAFLIFSAVILMARKRMDRGLWAYALVLGLFCAMVGNLMSYPRYLLTVFPFFIALALRFRDRLEIYLVICLPLQALYAILQSLNYWVT